MADNWLSCDQDGCSGASITGKTRCLAHVRAEERAGTLQQFSMSGRLDVRGVTISKPLLKDILDAAPLDRNGNPVFLDALFSKATFEGDAKFDEATFKSAASFDRATFKDSARFNGATFEGKALFYETTFNREADFEKTRFNFVLFSEATFEGNAKFDEATFKSAATFDRATFKDSARFDGATFEGNAWFNGTIFKSTATFFMTTFRFPFSAIFDQASFRFVNFGRATFESAATFSGATFNGMAKFIQTTFKRRALFDGATFKRRTEFNESTFERAAVLGPLTVDGKLDLDGVEFASPIRIEADTTILTCRRGRFLGGVQFEMRRALIFLDDSDFSVPSLLTGPADPEDTTKRPKLLSLQRANVGGLTLGNVDLTDCRFAGAHSLDKLRLEGPTVFGLSPARAGWERRQVIAEESAWRANRDRPGRWAAPSWPDLRDALDPWERPPPSPGILASQGNALPRPEPLSTRAIAGLYRALRKGREDVKDEPDAADFYYGEMEMRRHDRGTADTGGRARGRVSRVVLTAYWLISGYGLRAWRSLTALAVVTVLFAVAFYFVGFTQPLEPDSYWTSLLFAFRSTISLTDNQVKLTAWGSFFQALLRLTGPVLLALTLLALRGRVKR